MKPQPLSPRGDTIVAAKSAGRPHRHQRSAQIGAIVLLAGLMLATTTPAALAQAPIKNDTLPNSPPAANKAADAKSSQQRLQFAFEGTPWRDVIEWIAAESDLALHLENLPVGSFTYNDTGLFTPQEAIDRVNLFLLAQGFTLVRSGNFLSVINTGDPRSLEQLDVLAKVVTPDQLSALPDHEVVKCIFALGEIDAADAAEELAPLKLLLAPSIFTKTNRLQITDTVAKLRNVQAILAAFEPSKLDNGTVMKTFTLQFVDAEDILDVARPHLGLATGETIGIDVSLSADLQGKNIFVTGVDDKVKLVEGLIKSLDVAQNRVTPIEGDAHLKTYAVEGGNVEIVYNVLQTLLAGKSVRLSMDEVGGSVVALASPEIHTEIAETVDQLQAAESEFAVIELKNIDPYLAVSLLEEMLDLSDARQRSDAGMEAFTRHGNSRGLELLNASTQVDVPRIDADAVNRRLFVHARKGPMAMIKKMVAELDSGTTLGDDNEIRLFQMATSIAESSLQTAATFWRAANPIILYPAVDSAQRIDTERVLSGAKPSNPVATPIARGPQLSPDGTPKWLTDPSQSGAAPIRCQLTTRGLMLQCQDTAILDRFEKHLRAITGPADSTPSPPVVFYLEYTRPDDAIRILAEMLDGGEAAKEAETGALVNGYVSGMSGSFYGSLVTTTQGTMTMTAESITVVADPRLNRLIVQGTAEDIEVIEGYLQIIDKDQSIASIKTYGRSHVIELVHTPAAEVATAIQAAFAGRISGGSGPAGKVAAGQAAPREAADAKSQANDKGGDKKTARAAPQATSKDLEPKMTIAIHEPSNSLIITAPDQLYAEVQQLAEMIDGRNEKFVQINPANQAVYEALMQMFPDQTSPVAAPSRPTSPGQRPTSGGSSPATNRGKQNR